MNSINLIYFDAARASACMSVAVLAATLNAFIARLCDGVRSYYNCESWIIRFRETNSLQFLSHQLGFASSAYASPLFASPSGNDGAKALAEDREKQELRSKIRALEAMVRQPPPTGGGTRVHYAQHPQARSRCRHPARLPRLPGPGLCPHCLQVPARLRSLRVLRPRRLEMQLLIRFLCIAL